MRNVVEIAQGAFVGAIIGTAISSIRLLMKDDADCDVVNNTRYLKHYRDIKRVINKFSLFESHDPTLFRKISDMAEQLCKIKAHTNIKRNDAMRNEEDNTFKCNRLCSDFKKEIKKFVVSVSNDKNEIANVRNVYADEKPTINKFCDDLLHNLILR